jgi:copper chaperone CopZ
MRQLCRHVTSALKSVKGVEHVTVGNWKESKASVVAEKTVDEQRLLEAVRNAGYQAIVRERKMLDNMEQAAEGITPTTTSSLSEADLPHSPQH